jgi:hypothetical protein
MIHFHCTSATKMDGPGGQRLPFRIRTQTDSRGGVAVEVANRVGQPVTCAKLADLEDNACLPGQDHRDQPQPAWHAGPQFHPERLPTRGGCSSIGAAA